MVTLFVGPEKIKFTTYEDIMIEASDFFKTAFSSGSKEGQEKSINLPDESADIVEYVIHWLHEKEHEKNSGLSFCTFEFSLRLYTFADKMQMKPLRLKAFNMSVRHVTRCPPNFFVTTKHIRYIYENTVDGSRLRRLIVWLWT